MQKITTSHMNHAISTTSELPCLSHMMGKNQVVYTMIDLP